MSARFPFPDARPRANARASKLPYGNNALTNLRSARILLPYGSGYTLMARSRPVRRSGSTGVQGLIPTTRAPDRAIKISKGADALRQRAAELRAQGLAPVEDVLRLGPAPLPARAKPAAPPSDAVRRAVDAAQRALGEELTARADARGPGTSIGTSIWTQIGAPAELGRLVRARRTALGLNQQSLADRAKVGRRFVSELEGGKATLELGKVLEVCAAIDLTLQAIVAADGR
jgi:y4mF family transcriptional regulator